MKAILMLEDGKSFSAETMGVGGEGIGELVLNTAVVGYQEMITDPANAGKILVLTYPLIGNYGVAPKFNESKKAWVAGLVIKEKSRIYSNWQAKSSLQDFLNEQGVLAITGVDTRSLAVHLRQKGSMPGIISTQNLQPKELLAKIALFRKKTAQSLLPEISVKKVRLGDGARSRHKIGVLDLGVQKSILRQLESLGCAVTLIPFNTKPEEILKLKVKSLIISGGPEDDPGLKEVTANVKRLITRLPMLGISTGCEVLAQALGARLVKMKLGHRGVNYPIQGPLSYKGEITVQNHAYALDSDSLRKIKGVKITSYNLNDRTPEEIESRRFRIMGVQYYPASPGLGEVNSVFKRFLKTFSRRSR